MEHCRGPLSEPDNVRAPEEGRAGQVGALGEDGVQAVAPPLQLPAVHRQRKGHVRRL